MSWFPPGHGGCQSSASTAARRRESAPHSAELLYDDASGCAAVRRTGHTGEITVYASVPQRIGTLASLAEVILSDGTVWIRTSDGDLWLAPALPGRGLSWGYSGGGPGALAALLDRLLDDITAPPVAAYDSPPRVSSPDRGHPPRRHHRLQPRSASRSLGRACLNPGRRSVHLRRTWAVAQLPALRVVGLAAPAG